MPEEKRRKAWWARWKGETGGVGPFRFGKPLTEAEAIERIERMGWPTPDETWPAEEER